ncbi:histone-lysine N-methyltransferase SETMAR [Plakobranchus ocellatus]|uniref:Histone-lysine N-methyltransferase SETMAR n=1 Tax=Plakobranchus ocellatus TaxID=259542 RepID=A0AAV3XUK1_9GAST|nr:histone-lysine N-methyltransferase SETMAR [Plakobranchus ocellatus]
MINLAIAKFLPHGSPKCCQMSISARESKSPKSCCTGVNKKLMKPLMWGLAETIVSGISFLNTSSLDSRGMILLDILPKGESINADRYCEALDRLRHAVRRKRPGLVRNGVVLQHNNAIPHTTKRTKEWLERQRWDIILHPAHSPDLAPSNFHLFGPLKRHLGGKKFEDEDELIGEVRDWFSKLDANFFPQGIYSLLPRWQKCIALHGDYIEK